jgi:predicted nucleotidyltransferase component of viral defense system
MHIKNVIELVLVGIFSDSYLSKHVFLKGGSALIFLEKIDERKSTDVDLSTPDSIKDYEETFFERIKKVLTREFKKHNYDVIDFKYYRKPKERRGRPEWWGGWNCEFKLCAAEHRKLSDERRRKRALIPEGSNTSKIEIQISEHEYCGKARSRTIKGVKINGYTRALLVVEKLRAICQQHPDYKFRMRRNRVRDVVDIYHLTRDHQGDKFLKECKAELPKAFAAKEVDTAFLKALFDDEFVDMLKAGFPQVQDTLKGTVYPVDTYIEYLRDFVRKIT